MIKDIEVKDPYHETGNKGFKVKTKPRNFERSAMAISRYRQRRSAEIKIGINFIIILIILACIMIKTGVICY